MRSVETVAPTTRARVDWVDSARGIAIVLVVLYHAANWLIAAGLHTEQWQQVNSFLMTLRMPLFFTMAGLFAGKWVTGDWSALWRSKLSLYLWVLVIWEAIGSFTFSLGQAMQDECCNVRRLALDVVISPVAPTLELWFIWALTLYFVVAKLLRRVDPRVQLVGAAVLAAVTLSGFETANIGWTKAPQFFFFFMAGLHLKPLILKFGTAMRWPHIVGFFALWAGVSSVVWAFDLSAVPGVYFVNALLGVFGGLALSRLVSRLTLFSWLGSRTLQIYLAHTPIILIVCSVLAFTPLGALAAPITPLTVPILAAIAIVLALLLHRHTPAPWLYAQPRWFAELPAKVARRRRSGGKSSPEGVATVRPSPAPRPQRRGTDRADGGVQ